MRHPWQRYGERTLIVKRLVCETNDVGAIPTALTNSNFMACWRSGLTHIPFTDTFTGSNPVQVTILLRQRRQPGDETQSR